MDKEWENYTWSLIIGVPATIGLIGLGNYILPNGEYGAFLGFLLGTYIFGYLSQEYGLFVEANDNK